MRNFKNTIPVAGMMLIFNGGGMTEFSITVWGIFYIFAVGPFVLWRICKAAKVEYEYGLSIVITLIFSIIALIGLSILFLLWITGKHLLGV